MPFDLFDSDLGREAAEQKIPLPTKEIETREDEREQELT